MGCEGQRCELDISHALKDHNIKIFVEKRRLIAFVSFDLLYYSNLCFI